MSELYKRIEALCKREEINITEMCKLSGASRGSLSDLKVGRRQSLSAETLEKIAGYFETTVDYLLGRTDDPYDYENDPNQLLGDIPLEHLHYYQEEGLSEEEIIKRHLAYKEAVAKDVEREKEFAFFGESTITFDSFTYAMQEETKNLTEKDKALLLSMAKQLNSAREQKDGEDN